MFTPRWLLPILGVAVLLIHILATACAPGAPALGTAQNPVKMAFVPSVESTKVLADGKVIADLLEKETKLKFEVSVPNSYAAVIEAMGANKVDVAWLAPLQYVVARNKVGAKVIITVTRRGAKSYGAQILVRADSGIKSVADLKGKKFAFTDPLSASGNLYCRAFLRSKGIDPVKDLQTTYAGGHDKVVIAVYNKQVDAGCTFDGGPTEARNRVKSTLPDVMEKVIILDKTGNIIPNDTVSVRKGLPDDLVKKIRDGLIAVSKTDEGKKAMTKLYDIDGMEVAVESDYDPILKEAEAAGIDLGEAIKPPPTPTPKP